ncbi:uncharacterized protein LOC62_05G007701 [Vanrija pseudolonga]|uniref:Uncharacterized protein n=1 Tax=Vanrija pseudolonga TaxID=143232 RepID=A0AAF1BN96_9TREE|nr:hypothetical protein LOC62_05G007701 [Vanrija pseudolonga]
MTETEPRSASHNGDLVAERNVTKYNLAETPRPDTRSAETPGHGIATLQQAERTVIPATPTQVQPTTDNIPPPYSEDRHSVAAPNITEEAFIQRIADLQADAVRANRAVEEAREAAEMAQIAAAEAVTRLAALERREEARLALAVFERREELRSHRKSRWQFWRGRH